MQKETCEQTALENVSLNLLVFLLQVSFVQYSDDAKTEFRLNAYQDKGTVMSAVTQIRYRGGNTKTGSVTCCMFHHWGSQTVRCPDFLLMCLCQTGVALKHTYEKAFSVENGMRRNVPKVVVAITDGRSQDEVKKNAAKLQHAGKRHTREKNHFRNVWTAKLCFLFSSSPQVTAFLQLELLMLTSWSCRRSAANPATDTSLLLTTLMLSTPSKKTSSPSFVKLPPHVSLIVLKYI